MSKKTAKLITKIIMSDIGLELQIRFLLDIIQSQNIYAHQIDSRLLFITPGNYVVRLDTHQYGACFFKLEEDEIEGYLHGGSILTFSPTPPYIEKFLKFHIESVNSDYARNRTNE